MEANKRSEDEVSIQPNLSAKAPETLDLREPIQAHGPTPFLAYQLVLTLLATCSTGEQAQKAWRALRSYGTRRDLRAGLRGNSILPGM